MELGSIVDYLENKTILVTGATGFVATTFVEKILRIQPKVKKLYLLLRAADTESAIQRLYNEVLEKELFQVLKEKSGSNLNSLISEKVVPVPGDISCENLGIKDASSREEMWRDLDVVVNSAATTKFYERYEVALGVNALGAMHVGNFAKKCVKLKVLVHLSTAYVCGESENERCIQEKPFSMGETLDKGSSRLDIKAEMELAEKSLSELGSAGSTEKEITSAMKDLGITRAKMHGWPNTYVFTKAMGEMLVGHLKENMSVVIIRPTIISSTYKEPFPGWIEGVRTIDSVAVGYGKGKVTCLFGDPKSIVDVVPVDMVVNSILAAIVFNADHQSSEIIYQVGSSMRNPLLYKRCQEIGLRYFVENPWINKDGTPVKVGKITVLENMASFHRYMGIRYIIPLKGLQLVNLIFCQFFLETYTKLSQKIKVVMQLVELYKPYLFFKGVFDDMNTEKLRMAIRESCMEEDMFYFDPKHIDWEDYFMNIHLPGAVKYVFK